MRILDLHEIGFPGRGELPPLPMVDGRPVCLVCLERPRELKWRPGGYLKGREIYKRRCYRCRRIRGRYSGPDAFGSRDFPCEGHRWTRCSLCPRDPVWEVAPDRLSVLALYRLGMWDNRDSGSGEVLPCGPYDASFYKWQAVEAFGAEPTSLAWREGLTALDADEWAPRLTGRHPLSVWPNWETLAEAEAAGGGSPGGQCACLVTGSLRKAVWCQAAVVARMLVGRGRRQRGGSRSVSVSAAGGPCAGSSVGCRGSCWDRDQPC